MKQAIRRTIAAGAFGLLASTASGALVTLSGSHIDIVYDDSQPTLLAFGSPTLVGDLLTFSPSNFKAQATSQIGLDVEANTVNVKIVLHDGFIIQSVGMHEGGDYLVWGNSSFVNVGGQTRVFDLAQGPPGLIMPISVSGIGVKTAAPDATTTNWEATTFSNLSGSNYAHSKELSYSLQNILLAFAAPPADPNSPTLGFIEKKFVEINVAVAPVAVTPIPEAEVWAMMLVGVGLVGFQLRRKARRMATHRLA